MNWVEIKLAVGLVQIEMDSNNNEDDHCSNNGKRKRKKL